MDDKVVETRPNDFIRVSEPACVLPAAGSSFERPCGEQLVSELGKPPAELSDTVTEMLDHSQASSNRQDTDHMWIANSAEIPSKQ